MNLIRHNTGIWIRRGLTGKFDADVIAEVIGQDGYRLKGRRPPKTVLDIGAHIGSFSVRCHSLFPRCQIACVEVCPNNWDCLEKNVNGVTVYRAALAYGQPVGLLNCFGNAMTATGASRLLWDDTPRQLFYHQGGFESTDEIRVVTIESIMYDMEWEAIDLLKLDCEGSEHNILRNSPAVRDGGVHRIIGEFHGGEEWAKTLRQLSDDWRELRKQGGDIGGFELIEVR